MPARERTTTELLRGAAAGLLGGPRGRRFEPLFDEADLVKFARRRPTAGTADRRSSRGRAESARWSGGDARAAVARRRPDAVR